jgi:hypothetical protein
MLIGLRSSLRGLEWSGVGFEGKSGTLRLIKRGRASENQAFSAWKRWLSEIEWPLAEWNYSLNVLATHWMKGSSCRWPPLEYR